MGFPDIACRAQAAVIDDALGIIVDGKAGAALKQDEQRSAPTLEKPGGCSSKQEEEESSEDGRQDTVDCEPSTARDATHAHGAVSTPGATTGGTGVITGFRKALQASRERTAPRQSSGGFESDFIGFERGQAQRGAGQESGAGKEPAAGHKRRRDEEQADEAGESGWAGDGRSAAAQEVDLRAPWARGRRYQSNKQDKTVNLHNEVLDFVAFIEPTKSEIKRRDALVDLVRATVIELWPTAKLEVYGSYATGMYLPSSDIDMVILGCPEEKIASLRKLGAVIKADENFDKIQIIDKARVPIIKWEDVPSGIPLNICMDQEDGLVNTAWVQDQRVKLQPLHPLLLVLKQFLYNRDLHETYSGGVGSYLLTMTIISFLQHHPGRGPDFKRPETNLGALLMDYLHLYGLRFNMEVMGISTRGNGMYFEKESIGWHNDARPFLLCVEDPNKTDSDLGKNSYNIRNVQRAFEHAFFMLAVPENNEGLGDTMLGSILKWDQRWDSAFAEHRLRRFKTHKNLHASGRESGFRGRDVEHKLKSAGGGCTVHKEKKANTGYSPGAQAQRGRKSAGQAASRVPVGETAPGFRLDWRGTPTPVKSASGGKARKRHGW